MKLYLAHPLELRKEIREIELAVEKETGIELVNPFYDTGRDDIEAIDAGHKTRSDKNLNFTKIVEKDIGQIEGSDGIVAYIQKGVYSIGTMFELWETAIHNNKLVYVVSPDSLMHPWIRYLLHESMGRGFKSWDEFKAYFSRVRQEVVNG